MGRIKMLNSHGRKRRSCLGLFLCLALSACQTAPSGKKASAGTSRETAAIIDPLFELDTQLGESRWDYAGLDLRTPEVPGREQKAIEKMADEAAAYVERKFHERQDAHKHGKGPE